MSLSAVICFSFVIGSFMWTKDQEKRSLCRDLGVPLSTPDEEKVLSQSACSVGSSDDQHVVLRAWMLSPLYQWNSISSHRQECSPFDFLIYIFSPLYQWNSISSHRQECSPFDFLIYFFSPLYHGTVSLLIDIFDPKFNTDL
ncbi:hypothetical protein AVEN_223982-1 [Araneus ventricosus]|uniref:Uncharacterized protein n=1 Tax=Araneus ventricosus TaxID=182803 RepID=A0A4Y2GGW2_ARAVE|nr:hypothetical protein AVEN_223982-1 [Araneus ventricosus]